MEALTKKDLRETRNMIADIIDHIDDLLNLVDLQSAESNLGEALSNAQSELNSALGTIDEEL